VVQLFGRWSLAGTGLVLIALFWTADAFLDGVFFAEGGFVQQLLRPEPRELVYRLQTIAFLVFFIAYARRRTLTQERLAVSLEETRARLTEEKNRSEAILSAIPDAVSVQDTELRILYQNPAHKKMMGDHVGKFCYAAYQHRATVCDGCHLVASFRDGLLHHRETSSANGHGGRLVEIFCVPLRDVEGRIIAGIESVRDITGRKIAENRLRQQLAAIEASMDGIAILDASGEYLYLNRAHATVYGYPTPDELLGKSWHVLYTPEERQRLEPLINAGFELDRGWRGEATGLRKDGSLYPQEISLSLLEDGGIICVVRDITERKLLEDEARALNESLARHSLELQATNRELEAFGYSLSHDLRSPLTVTFTAAQVLDDMYWERLDETGRELLRTVRSGCENMEELIEAMLMLFRVTRSELSDEEVDLSSLAGEIMAEIQLQHPAREVSWRLTAGMTARLDPHLARILLENLLGNAWKYSARRDLSIIEFGHRSEGGKTEFFVRDNGIGFDMATAEKMFQPFQRLHCDDDFPGHGIGLATVKRIIDRHGGRIDAEGEVGQGATFFFSLSAASGQATSPPA
jgi:PAS domain S-box-containing protein